MVKKIFHTIGSQFLTAILNFLTFVIISRTFGSEIRGEAGILLSSVALGVLFVNLIAGATQVYLFPRVNKGMLLVLSYLWAIIVSALFSVIISFFGTELGYKEEWAVLTALLIFGNAVLNTHLNLLISLEKIRLNNAIKILQSATVLMVIFLTIKNIIKSPDSNAYPFALSMSYFITAIGSFFWTIQYLTEIKFNEFKSILKQAISYGIINQFAHLIQFLNFRVSYYVLHSSPLQLDLGSYANAVSICEALWMISRSVALVQYGHLVNTNDLNYQKKTSLILAKWTFIISAIAVTPLMALPAGAFTTIFGKDFSLMSEITPFLAPSIALYSFGLIIQHYYSSRGIYKYNVYSAIVGFILTIVFLPFLIQHYKEAGAAMTSSLSYLSSTLFIVLLFLKKEEISTKYLIPRISEIRLLFNIGAH